MAYEEYDERKPQEEDGFENTLELQKWLNDPAAKKLHPEMHKDLPLSNLTNMDAAFINECMELQKQLKAEENKPAFEEFIKFLQFLAYSRANISLGIKATGRKLMFTSHRYENVNVNEQPKSRSFWGGGGKRQSEAGG